MTIPELPVRGYAVTLDLKQYQSPALRPQVKTTGFLCALGAHPTDTISSCQHIPAVSQFRETGNLHNGEMVRRGSRIKNDLFDRVAVVSV